MKKINRARTNVLIWRDVYDEFYIKIEQPFGHYYIDRNGEQHDDHHKALNFNGVSGYYTMRRVIRKHFGRCKIGISNYALEELKHIGVISST